MNKIETLSLIETVLGNSKQTGPDNYAFYCPYCKHYKRKLEINLETFNFHCWTCQPKLGGRNFYYLFRDLPNITETQLDKIKEYTKTHVYKKSEKSESVLRLPKEFKTMAKVWNSIEYKHANAYLRRRGISQLDVKKYNIGYCEEGEYEGRVVVPSYDADRELNYFVSRTFFDSALKYKNPRVSKDIVAFESLISWNHPIVLVEGVFDAIAIRRNAIPLLGKNVQPTLRNKLELNKVKDIYVCLDKDAREDAIAIAQELLNQGQNRNVYVVKLEQKDPSEIGFHEINQIIRETPKFDFKNLIYVKLFE